MQMDLCLDLALSIDNHLGFFLSDVWTQLTQISNSDLPGLGFSVDLGMQADTLIKQCCYFSWDSLAFETDKKTDKDIFEYHRHKESG